MLSDPGATNSLLRAAMIKTCDADICHGIVSGENAIPVHIEASLQYFLAQHDTDRFIFMAEYGMAPVDLAIATSTSDILEALLDALQTTPGKGLSRAIQLWAGRDNLLSHTIYRSREAGVISTPIAASVAAQIIRAAIARDPDRAVRTLAHMATRSDAFSNMAMMLGGCRPVVPETSRPEAARIINSFGSRHGHLEMERFMVRLNVTCFSTPAKISNP